MIALAVILVVGAIVYLFVKFNKSGDQATETAFQQAKKQIAKDALEANVPLTRDQINTLARTRVAREKARETATQVRARKTLAAQ